MEWIKASHVDKKYNIHKTIYSFKFFFWIFFLPVELKEGIFVS